MDEATIRRIIREELDNYDRDKGITPRMSRGGERSDWTVNYRGHACACGPGQCARLQAGQQACAGYNGFA